MDCHKRKNGTGIHTHYQLFLLFSRGLSGFFGLDDSSFDFSLVLAAF
jgi:hypothetical protein